MFVGELLSNIVEDAQGDFRSHKTAERERNENGCKENGIGCGDGVSGEQLSKRAVREKVYCTCVCKRTREQEKQRRGKNDKVRQSWSVCVCACLRVRVCACARLDGKWALGQREVTID